ncbi:hypothetical protein COLO4_02193, partial [Corchorus olitorius]
LQRQRGRHVDRRNGTDGDTDQHGQREAFQQRATKDEQDQDHRQRGDRGDQRTAQRLGQRHVSDVVRRTATDFAEVLTNTVGNHDLIVERVTNHRHQRRHNRQIDLDVEQRQNAAGDDHVVRQRQHGAQRQTPLKAKADVDQNRNQRRQQRHRSGLRQIAAHARAHELNSLHGRVLLRRL